MSNLAVLLAMLGTMLIGAISPGPSFVFVVRISVARSRADGLAAAAGMGIGAATYGALGLVGLHALMTQAAWLYWALKIAGGLYLIYLAVMIWRHAAEPIAVTEGAAVRSSPGRSALLGLATQLSNPKIVAVYGAVFAALLPPRAPLWLALILPPLLFVQETAWYALVALAFSLPRPRAVYLRAKTWIDRTAGAIIGLLGLRLMLEAR
jgi:threonine/homoserine/homoserine lactone efflux protein